MKVRLGFAVASQMEPDVLLIDEVLAVGDVGFKLKCFNAIGRLLENSAVILVSHAMPQIARVSTEILMMKRGQIYLKTDIIAKAIEEYYAEFESSKMQAIGKIVEIVSLNIYSENSKEENGVVCYDHDMILDLKLRLNQDIEQLSIGITFFDREQKNLASTRFQSFIHSEANAELKIAIPSIQFATGLYTVTFTFSEIFENQRTPHFLGRVDSFQEFKVKGATDFNQSSFILKSYLKDSLSS
jgi:lipopolysaccharide transport system ATP-binding protein